MIKSAVQWGLVGTSDVAASFASQLTRVEGASPLAVASRTQAKAEAFRDAYGLRRAYAGIDALCDDPDVDAVYVASPTRLHRAHGTKVLESGKALLCEKPFGPSVEDATALVKTARETGQFCMEAMWMRFNPLVQRVRSAIDDGRVGAVRYLHGELGYQKSRDTLGTAEEGRGALLAFGCYGVSLALYLFGEPVSVVSDWTPNPQGGDETATLVLRYEDQVVSFTCSEGVTLNNDVRIQGTDGSIYIGAPFIDATRLTVVDMKAIRSRSLWERLQAKAKQVVGEDAGTHTLPEQKLGFRYEAQEATDCIRAGKLESDVMPLDETLAVHRILDAALQRPDEA